MPASDVLACRRPALGVVLGVLLALQGCASRNNKAPDEESPEVVKPAETALSFELEVRSDNRAMRRHLRRHLELQRFASFTDLQANELRRLLAEADTNARDLLAAQGYFNPELTLSLEEPGTRNEATEDPQASPSTWCAKSSGCMAAPNVKRAPEATHRVVIEVKTGPRARVVQHQVNFEEPMDSDAAGARQRNEIRRDWLLRDGDRFTQLEWDAAKAEGLRVLQRDRYATARIASSQAIVNADTSNATLDVTYDAGPLFRFGELELQGIERYDADGIRNIVRIPTGQDYSEQTLLEAQQRLASSGYFDSAFLVLDTDGPDPNAAKVVAQLKEAEYQKIIFGLGYSTDAGPRFSVDHTHNRMWPLHWRARNQLAVGTQTQSLITSWTDLPTDSGWAWYTSLALDRQDYGDYKTNSASLTGGRTRSAERTERRYYLQYDASAAEGGDAPGGSSSLLGNYSWAGRYFNNNLNPTRGRAYGIEGGVGLTVTPERKPFLRTVLRGLQLFPFGARNPVGKRNRIALRLEGGAVLAKDDVNIPVPLLFLTGGDTTVRGYAFQSIGNVLDDGSVFGARYMAIGSLEWQRPLTLFGDARSFETAVFMDAGTASDSVDDAVLHTGTGAGLRWAGPIGPVQADIAYGNRTREWRVHLRVGFQF